MRSLTAFSLGGVIGVLTVWLDPDQGRPILASDPRLEPWIDDLDTTRAQLTAVENLAEKAAEDVPDDAQGGGAWVGLNRRADAALRAYRLGLLLQIEWAKANDDDADAARWQALLDHLFPDGMAIARAPLLAQVGGAERLVAQARTIDPATADRIAFDTVRHADMLDQIETTHRALSAYDAARRKALLDASDAPKLASANQARRAALTLLRRMIDLIQAVFPDPNDPKRLTLLSPLQ